MTDSTLPLEALLDQARELRERDDSRAALLFEQVVAGARAQGAHPLLADALNALAGLEHERGDSQGALAHLNEALSIRRALDDQGGCAAVLCNIGAVQLDLGSFNLALSHLLQADHAAQQASPARAAVVAANLAKSYDALNLPAQASAQYTRALTFARSAGQPFGEATVMINHADLLRREGHFAQAMELLTAALELAGERGALAASAWHTMGQVHRDRGETDAALTHFRTALATPEADIDVVLHARCDASELLLNLDAREEARALLSAALPAARASRRTRIEARVLALQARAEEQGGELQQALGTLRRAHRAEADVLRAEAEQRTRELTARSELERDRLRLENEQARYQAERAAKEQLAREQASRLQELERLALYDALTGLPNRLLLSERARTALSEAAARGTPLAVGVMDLNKFKAVNDTHGHHTGDLLLREVARRLPLAVGHRDTVARTGGDEFVFLLHADRAALAELAQQLVRTFDEAFFLDGLELHMRPSLGFACYPDEATDLDGLLARADEAMYRAKARGSTVELGSSRGELAPATLEAALHGALAADEFQLVYQPLEDPSGRWHGAEALLRWRSRTYGNVTPDQFMPLAERSGLSLQLSAWTLTQVCAALARLPELGVAINLSARQLVDPALPGRIVQTAGQFGVSPSRLNLEVSEALVARAPERAHSALRALAATGVHLTLDDFGGGHAHLAGLQHLPIHAVKLDRALVQGLGQGPRGVALLGAVTGLARALDLKVIAKGVETPAHRAQLNGLGVHSLQGFLISPPLEFQDLQAWTLAGPTEHSG
ncbi:putative bifunctional diguanylate cyclase/phosphodiesterase [Deinococcus aerophilus]|uniref:GGDEF-domain containing protein n=1 Tax=Deinococcus aerophilus TaxID=522488 RepID=A0ABQ2GXZ9_9DEIO|nr:EAL domain-containing protein [Deinococcus aerophilus]GGM19336.1 hypothetical protein GCM10010841_29220 [Deinococcus aerophilus]